MKIFKIYFLVCIFAASAFCASQVYYIQARGEFGKELAEMAKKQANEANQTIQVFVDEDPRRYKDNRILKLGVAEDIARRSVRKFTTINANLAMEKMPKKDRAVRRLLKI